MNIDIEKLPKTTLVKVIGVITTEGENTLKTIYLPYAKETDKQFTYKNNYGTGFRVLKAELSKVRIKSDHPNHIEFVGHCRAYDVMKVQKLVSESLGRKINSDLEAANKMSSSFDQGYVTETTNGYPEIPEKVDIIGV